MSAASVRARWRPSRAALVTIGVLLLAAVLIWVGGGWAKAPAGGVRALPADRQIELSRWTLVVQKAELANRSSYGSEQATTIRIWLQLTWNGQETTPYLDDRLVTLRVPGGPEPDPQPVNFSVLGYSGGFDPGVTRPLVLDYTWPQLRDPADDTTQPAVPAVPGRVDLVIRDERLKPNFLDPDYWTITEPIGYVSLPVVDVRQR